MISGSTKHVRSGELIAKRWPVVGGMLLIVALGWAGWQVPRPLPPEPVYERKR